MKKYKLIKEYPGSPIIGTIAKFEKGKWYCHMIPKLQGSDDELHSLGCGEVKLYPEFWEEVVEKDYEILEYKTESGISCKAPFLSDSHQFYIDERCKIYSIKRISDNSIFTIGDDVLSKTCSVPNKILSIELINNKIRLYSRNSFYNLNDIEKFKQPLFTTEDGVDIFEGDKIYSIESSLNEINEKIAGIYTRSSINHPVEHWYKDNKYFSTKEKAEEYILMNKPCLSLNDVAKVYVSAGFEITNSNKNIKYVKQQLQLRELIKTKLKKAL